MIQQIVFYKDFGLFKTNYKNIIFNDREDFLLGIGDGSGQNFIGKYLEKIRDKLFE